MFVKVLEHNSFTSFNSVALKVGELVLENLKGWTSLTHRWAEADRRLILIPGAVKCSEMPARERNSPDQKRRYNALIRGVPAVHSQRITHLGPVGRPGLLPE